MASLLQGVRSDGALFGRTAMRPPWSVRFEDRAPLTLVAMLRGDGWILADGELPVALHEGAIGVVRGSAAFSIADAPEPRTAALYVVGGDDRRADEIRLGARTCGAALDGPAMLLTARYGVSGSVCARLLGGLPPVVVVPDDRDQRTILRLAVAEIERSDPGQQAVLDRLLDLLLLTTLRAWFNRPEACPPAWYRALADPIVGQPLRLMHEEPARRWTLAALAAEAGVSRATFARRFTEVVGEPPMSYLTGWRLSLAADLLSRTDASVDSIARRVGYQSGFGLSVAFKRVYGTRPSDHRRRAA